MKNFLLILTFLQLTLISSAQSIVSNEISWFKGIYEKMDFYDEDGSTTISVAPRCYKQEEPKKWVKHIEVNDQSYFINSNGIIGMQTVYNNSGEHIANMDRNGYKLILLKKVLVTHSSRE